MIKCSTKQEKVRSQFLYIYIYIGGQIYQESNKK